jgi:uncharacterized protein with PhoU and TrkA domain
MNNICPGGCWGVFFICRGLMINNREVNYNYNLMAELSDETITTILELERRLSKLIHQAAATELSIWEHFGETEATASVLEQLSNIRERATSAYSRLSNLLLRISEFQPIAPPATLELLAQTIDQAEATADAGDATVREAKSDWNLL